MVQVMQQRPDFMNLMFIEIVEFKSTHIQELFNLIMPQAMPLVLKVMQAPSRTATDPTLYADADFYWIVLCLLSDRNRHLPIMLRQEFRLGAEDYFVDLVLHGILAQPSSGQMEALMINSRLTSLIRKEFIQILRDPRTLVLVLVIPVMQLFLLGYAATNDVRNVSLAVYDQDRGPAARELLDAYRAADYFRDRL